MKINWFSFAVLGLFRYFYINTFEQDETINAREIHEQVVMEVDQTTRPRKKKAVVKHTLAGHVSRSKCPGCAHEKTTR